jgi:hypothetical protein
MAFLMVQFHRVDPVDIYDPVALCVAGRRASIRWLRLQGARFTHFRVRNAVE